MVLINKFGNKLLSKDPHTRSNQLNIFLIMLLRAASILCSFLLVPLMLKYLDKSNFGVWLTLTSITSWISFMDIGLGNGLRNKLTEAITLKDKKTAVEYVSTTYGVFTLIIGGILLLFVITNTFYNWNAILKTNMSYNTILYLTYIVIISFCLRLILDLIGVIVTALHKPYIKAIIDFLINFIVLTLTYSLGFFSTKSFSLFGTVNAVTPVIILFGFSLVLFRKKSAYNYLRPTAGSFKKEHIKSLLNLGMQFFLIQISTLIVFSTDNILITQLFSPADVTNFNIAYKYFSIMTIVFGVILIPYWASFTAAYTQKNFTWIKGAFKKLFLLWIFQVLGLVIMILFAKYFYKIWVGNDIVISFYLNVFLGFYVAISSWNNIFVYFLNGISKIRLQLYSSITIGLINIPLSYFISKHTNLGASAIVLSNCICLVIVAIWAPIQCYRIINGKASGIWNK